MGSPLLSVVHAMLDRPFLFSYQAGAERNDNHSAGASRGGRHAACAARCTGCRRKARRPDQLRRIGQLWFVRLSFLQQTRLNVLQPCLPQPPHRPRCSLFAASSLHSWMGNCMPCLSPKRVQRTFVCCICDQAELREHLVHHGDFSYALRPSACAGHKPTTSCFTEETWTNPEGRGVNGYIISKAR